MTGCFKAVTMRKYVVGLTLRIKVGAIKDMIVSKEKVLPKRILSVKGMCVSLGTRDQCNSFCTSGVGSNSMR